MPGATPITKAMKARSAGRANVVVVLGIKEMAVENAERPTNASPARTDPERRKGGVANIKPDRDKIDIGLQWRRGRRRR
jgi:hypothetical protein